MIKFVSDYNFDVKYPNSGAEFWWRYYFSPERSDFWVILSIAKLLI